MLHVLRVFLAALPAATIAFASQYSFGAPQGSAPIGFHDQVTPIGVVSGWAVDTDSPSQPVNVNFYLDGPSGVGRYVGSAITGGVRNDVNRVTGHAGNHGFDFEMPSEALLEHHAIYAYAVKSGNEHLVPGSPKSFSPTSKKNRQPNLGSIWLNPPIGANDWKGLYRNPETWVQSRKYVSVLQIQDWALAPKFLSDDDVNAMVSALRIMRLSLSLETGVVKHWGCTAQKVLPVALSYMDRLVKFGGAAKFIAMDEPLVSRMAAPLGCGLSLDQIAEETAKYIDGVKNAYPDVKIGDIEPWPSIDKNDLKRWITSLEKRTKHKLAFLRLDVDCDAAFAKNSDMEDVREIADFVRSRGISFSIIIPALSSLSDSLAHRYGMACAAKIHEVTSIDNAIVQSWEKFPKANLPEGKPHTFTNILNAYALQYPPAVMGHARQASSIPVDRLTTPRLRPDAIQPRFPGEAGLAAVQ